MAFPCSLLVWMKGLTQGSVHCICLVSKGLWEVFMGPRQKAKPEIAEVFSMRNRWVLFQELTVQRSPSLAAFASVFQELSGTPSHWYFLKSIAGRNGGLLRYK